MERRSHHSTTPHTMMAPAVTVQSTFTDGDENESCTFWSLKVNRKNQLLPRKKVLKPLRLWITMVNWYQVGLSVICYSPVTIQCNMWDVLELYWNKSIKKQLWRVERMSWGDERICREQWWPKLNICAAQWEKLLETCGDWWDLNLYTDRVFKCVIYSACMPCT